jgi:hypothetical protein
MKPIAGGLTLVLVSILMLAPGCSTPNDQPRMNASNAGAAEEASVGGEVTAVDATNARIVIREARSHSSITLDMREFPSRLSGIAVGDCILVSGRWKGSSEFVAGRIDAVRAGCL